MTDFVTLSKKQQDQLYKKATAFVQTHVTRIGDNVDVRLGPPHVTRTHMQCTLFGMNNPRLSREQMNLLDDVLPGAEYNPQGPDNLPSLDIPIKFERSQMEIEDDNEPAAEGSEGVPTLETPLLLLIGQVIVGGILYYRYTQGVAF